MTPAQKEVICWHFAGPRLRDGTPHPKPGITLPEIPDPVPCRRGYHGSEQALDALQYAPGPWVARVRLHGTIIPHAGDKYAASLRTGLTSYVDASEVLRAFGRWCALQVVDLWDAPPVVREYLETGREDLREAARYAATHAACAAAARAAAEAARSAAYAVWAAATYAAAYRAAAHAAAHAAAAVWAAYAARDIAAADAAAARSAAAARADAYRAAAAAAYAEADAAWAAYAAARSVAEAAQERELTARLIELVGGASDD